MKPTPSLTAAAPQAGILAPVPPQARYLGFVLTGQHAPAAALQRLVPLVDGERVVVGLGPRLVAALGAEVPGLRPFAALQGPAVTVPATPGDLWLWLRGRDRGRLVLDSLALQAALAPALRLDTAVEAFRHGRGPNGHGRDLTGYEDGTENPVGAEAERAALVRRPGAGLRGASFVAVQQWVHDFAAFQAMDRAAQDACIGRRRRDNAELDDAPATAHVRRTAQESFRPEAFVLRRSMPWVAGDQAGLVFVAFGRSFEAFEAQLRRMAGLEDGITDALFGLSRPVTGAQYWCPPMRGGRLDLRRLGL